MFPYPYKYPPKILTKECGACEFPNLKKEEIEVWEINLGTF
jgi:hypothetical protein